MDKNNRNIKDKKAVWDAFVATGSPGYFMLYKALEDTEAKE
ncbi:MAG: hypothetical protein R3Y23_01965 [Bacillota bacterium]